MNLYELLYQKYLKRHVNLPFEALVDLIVANYLHHLKVQIYVSFEIELRFDSPTILLSDILRGF